MCLGVWGGGKQQKPRQEDAALLKLVTGTKTSEPGCEI